MENKFKFKAESIILGITTLGIISILIFSAYLGYTKLNSLKIDNPIKFKPIDIKIDWINISTKFIYVLTIISALIGALLFLNFIGYVSEIALLKIAKKLR